MNVHNSKTSNGKDIVQFTYEKDKKKDYQFKAVMNSDGTFSFRPMCNTSKHLYVDFWDHLEIQDDDITDNAKFRVAYTGNSWFRISTMESDFEQVLRVESPYLDNLSKIVQILFNPNSLNHYWTFEEV